MKLLAWFGAGFLAIICGSIFSAISEYAYERGWWILGAPSRVLAGPFTFWLILLVLYPLAQGLRRKPISQTTGQLFGWGLLATALLCVIFGALSYAQEAYRLGGFIGAILAFAFLPIGVFVVGIFGGISQGWLVFWPLALGMATAAQKFRGEL